MMNKEAEMRRGTQSRMKIQPKEKMMAKRVREVLCETGGMELVQVAILVALAIGLGLIFKDRIMEFVTTTFDSLMSADF